LAGLLPGSAIAYSLMTGAAVLLGGDLHIGRQLLGPLDFQSAAAFLLPLFGLFALSTALAEVLPAFAELKKLFQEQLVPQLRVIPVWGLAVMAVGAGVGEEALFRGVLQTWLQTWLTAALPLASADQAAAAGVAAASLVFGALHALNPAYFFFATAAGVVFGVEYLVAGLPAAAATHAVYDFAALLLTIRMWGGQSSKPDS
jgi:membrane protease YdiL (CAAX protease family)